MTRLAPTYSLSSLSCFLLALSLVGICTLVRVSLLEVMALSAPFLLHFSFVILATVIGGGRTGFITVFLSALVIALLFIPPEGTLAFKSKEDTFATVLFCFVGTLSVILCDQMKGRLLRTLSIASLYTAVISSLENYAIFTLDPIGTITSWNPGVQNLLGYEPQDFIGKHYSQLFSEEDQEKNTPKRELLNAHLSGKLHNTYTFKRGDGTLVTAEGCVYCLRSPFHTQQGYVQIVGPASQVAPAQSTSPHFSN